jgi:GNAT superfamily N-acetyltransferase
MTLDSRYTWRRAEARDAPALEGLMQAAIAALLKPYLSSDEVTASFSIMGLDRQLIEDGTYLIVEYDGRLAASGGWSGRATLFGGDHTAGRDAQALDPASDPARMRAMYTHPDHTRRGLGRFILSQSEQEARDRGFRRATLVATMAGLPLYRACDYSEVEHFREATPSGVSVPLVRMEKALVR